jgi:hypothetical protein
MMHARKAERVLRVPTELPLWQIGLFVQAEYTRPILRLHIDRRAAPVPENARVGSRARYAGKGRTEGLPPGAYGCGEPSAPADIDPEKKAPRADVGLGFVLSKLKP